MRWLGLICALVVSAPLLVASAEPRRTLEAVTLRAKPGERAAVVARLPANAAVKVLGVEGRWLRVRAGNVEGYLTRTTVSPAGGDERADRGDGAPAGRWSAARNVDGALVSAMFVEVGATTAALRVEPRPEAALVVTVARGARLVVIDAARDPAWVRARDAAGREGWIDRAAIDNGASAVVVAGVDLRGGAGAAPARAEAAGARVVRAELGLGLRTLGMSLTSNGEGGLSNYVLDAEAIAATLELEAALPRPAGARLVVAADVRASASASSPGIAYAGPTAPAGKIPFRTLSGDVGVRVGTRARRVFELALRLGGHYDAFVARRVRNAGMLPREHLLGATLGARVDIVPARSRFTVTMRFDALVWGARDQTEGLEDGTSSTARALWGGLTMRCALTRRLAVFGSYDFARASTTWTGASVRQPGVTGTQRIDTAQVVEIGVSASL